MVAGQLEDKKCWGAGGQSSRGQLQGGVCSEAKVTHSWLRCACGQGCLGPPAGPGGPSVEWAGSHSAPCCRDTSGCLGQEGAETANQKAGGILNSGGPGLWWMLILAPELMAIAEWGGLTWV